MIYYMTFGTNDLARARRFYDPTLATLDVVVLAEAADECAYGHPGDADPSLWIVTPFDGQSRRPAAMAPCWP